MTTPEGPLRRAAVAGTWYPGSRAALASEVDAYLDAASPDLPRDSVRGLVAPHAGLMYSGPIAAWGYRSVQGEAVDLAVLVGPSHRLAFEGVALYARGAWDTPLGPAPIAKDAADAILAATPVVHVSEAAHHGEHSLEMQLPFLRRVLPDTPIVPLLMGLQTPETVAALGDGLAAALAGKRVLLVASSDLSHYLDSRAAGRMDRQVLDLVSAFDEQGLMRLLKTRPDHACGGGPVAAVMRAARALGARDARVLRYGDSGDVSGDKTAVVGYMAAAFGTFA
ncbi:MAG: putative cytosolic protein [Acidobacteria bacterium]|nr:putative cytosolic protein [Acidobacteriota bacterium]